MTRTKVADLIKRLRALYTTDQLQGGREVRRTPTPLELEAADALESLAPSANERPSDDLPLRCKAVGGMIDMRIGEKVLAHAVNISPKLWDGEHDRQRFRVTDPASFAKEVVLTINHEDEAGNTLLTNMLDEAIYIAIENGAEGVEELPSSSTRS